MVLFFAWAVAMTAVYASQSSSECVTATACTALELPASECDAKGVIYGSACASSADCAHVDTCCVNETGKTCSPCKTKDHLTCKKNSTASKSGVCKAIEGTSGMPNLNPDIFVHGQISDCYTNENQYLGSCGPLSQSAAICAPHGHPSPPPYMEQLCANCPAGGTTCHGWSSESQNMGKCMCAVTGTWLSG